jgi:hypothetical protein
MVIRMLAFVGVFVFAFLINVIELLWALISSQSGNLSYVAVVCVIGSGNNERAYT